MEKELISSTTKSDIILVTKSAAEVDVVEIEEKREIIRQKDGIKTWSSRLNCYIAYSCSVFCYISFQFTLLFLGNHGILALVPSVLVQILIAVPAAVLQIVLGRYIHTNIANCWSMHIMAKGILFCELATTSYYVMFGLAVTSFLMQYMFLSFTIPWTSCNTTWTTSSCYESQQYQKYFAHCLKYNDPEFCTSLKWQTSEMEYWKYVVSNPSSTAGILLQCLYSFLISVALFATAVKGVHSAEKSFSFFTILTVTLSLLLACVICMSSEFGNGLKTVFKIKYERLLYMDVWVEAYDVMIFVFGIGRLPLTFISSHADFQDDFFTEVLVICLVTIFCLLITLPSFCVFEVIKSNNYNSNKSGPLDIFILLSEAVLLFPRPKKLWAILYYLLLMLSTLGSLSMSLLALSETITGFAPEHLSLFYTSLIACTICFGFSLLFMYSNFNFVIFLDRSAVSILFLYLITLEVLYGIYIFFEDFHFMMGYPVPFFLKLVWIVSLPISFVMVVLNTTFYNTNYTNVITYVFLAMPFFLYFLSASIRIGIYIRKNKTVKNLFARNPDWGPADPLLKKSRMYFDSRAVTKEFVYRQELREKIGFKAPDVTEQSIVQVT